MKEPIKITTEELETFNKFKENIQKLMFEFGVLYFEKYELDKLFKEQSIKELSMIELLENSKKEENEFMESIFKKYGEGSLNIKEGLFTPN